MQIDRKRILRYALTPEIIPNLRQVGGAGFSHTAYFTAQVLRGCRLLPGEHPYLNIENLGKFGLRHVLAEAAGRLQFRLENIDQIFIFGVIVTGLVILAMQVALLVGSFMIHPLYAMTFSLGDGLFVIDDPTHDLAFIMMDRVFGIDGMFDSCVAQGIPCNDAEYSDGPDFPFPYHHAMHGLLAMYSMALLVVAVIIITYFAIAVVAETAKDGTPFGKRFNHVWAPVRLVVAVGLLIPVGEGLNPAQYITLHIAKWGSAMATNGWILFNEELNDRYGQGMESLIAEPNYPEGGRLVEFALVSHTCYQAYKYARLGAKPSNMTKEEAEAWGSKEAEFSDTFDVYVVRDPFMDPARRPLWEFADVEELLEFTNNQDIVIRSGEYKTKYISEKGYVKPLCGELVVPVQSVGEPGSMEMLNWYAMSFPLLLLGNMHNPGLQGETEDGSWISYGEYGEYFAKEEFQGSANNDTGLDPPDQKWKYTSVYGNGEGTVYGLNYYIAEAVEDAIEVQRNESAPIDSDLIAMGWGGAAIWYNDIASKNGAITTSILNLPRISKWPFILEEIARETSTQNQNASGSQAFDRRRSQGNPPEFENNDKEIYEAVNRAYVFFEGEDGGLVTSPHVSGTGNIFMDTINYILGTSGLFTMRKNNDVHPLAQLASVGRGLVEGSIRTFSWSVIAALTGSAMGDALFSAANFLMTVSTIGLAAGFALFYVIPFLPFIFFFFAFAGWVKTIFEAMVGVPLWALAHLRIDGEGLPGEAAASGYYLILDIFLRPILIVFGMLGSILIFAAMVDILHMTFDLMIENLAGFDVEAQKEEPDMTDMEFFRGPIDEFFFTVMYTIVVYIIGNSSFKMVTLIPNNLLRWIGSSVKTFEDQAGDQTQSLMRTVAIGGASVSAQLSGAGKGVISGVQAMKKANTDQAASGA